MHLEEKEKLATTLTHTSLQAAQVAKPVEAEKVGEEESAGVRLELEAVSRERDLLCLERTELLFHRNQVCTSSFSGRIHQHLKASCTSSLGPHELVAEGQL